MLTISSRTHDDYSQTEDMSSSQGALYSVSQRLPTVSTSFSSLCPTDAGYGTDQVSYSSVPADWEKNHIPSTSESNCDNIDEKEQEGKEN